MQVEAIYHVAERPAIVPFIQFDPHDMSAPSATYSFSYLSDPRPAGTTSVALVMHQHGKIVNHV